MSTEQDPRYAGYVQRKTAAGQPAEEYDAWKARIDGLDKARAVKAGEVPPQNPDDVADDTALDASAQAAQEMADIAEAKMALAEQKLAEAEAMMQQAREQQAAEKVAVVEAEPTIADDPTVNASALGPLTHVQAEAPARVQPKTLDDFEGVDKLHFSCPYNRNRVEVMQAGQKTLINNQIVVLQHKTIEFAEHHWSADLSDPEERERAAWLLQCKAFRTGEIVLVPTVAHTPQKVRTGPRTSGLQPAKIERPAGPLSVTVGAG